MNTATRADVPPSASPGVERPPRVRPILVSLAGPALIVVCVLIALRGFVFLPRITNQHPDILSFWLPRSCLLGDALADGRVPLWNPYEMTGTPFAADAQSGWLSASSMATSWLFGCGDGLRALIVLNPILAGLGLWWFLRKERLGRIAATAGGLSLGMLISASSIAVSLPFAGMLAWTPFVLVGASGFFSSAGWRRLVWLALSAVAWGQVATSHLSHGLVMATGLLAAYLLARAIHEVRAGTLRARTALLFGLGFLAFLPLANLAILIPRFALLERSSLRIGYGAFQGTLPPLSGDRPIPDHGVWSGWPLALASTPGAYAGAGILLGVALAFRDRARRPLVTAFAAAGVIGYLLTITLLVGAGWFRSLVLAVPFGDVYLHNPGRFRYLAFLVVPVLGAIGVQALVDRPPRFATAMRWLAIGIGVFLVFPLIAGAKPERVLVFAIGTVAVIALVWALASGIRWAPVALVGVLAVELLVGSLWSSAYSGGTVYLGLEGESHPALLHGPLRWPNVPLDGYLEPGPIARAVGANGGRYLAWIPPAAYFNKGYLFTQDQADWPALLLGRAIPLGLHDALGYSPIQVPRYWAFIRATNRLPVFYNAAVVQVPSLEDIRLLGVDWLIVHEGQPLPPDLTGEVIARERGYELVELDGAEPRVSVVDSWTIVEDGAAALAAVTTRGFDPAATAVIEEDPELLPEPLAVHQATASADEESPEDVRIAVQTTRPSLVVVRTAWEEGWTATVDGEPARVLIADGFLQGVPVPSGTHEIRLTYREPAIARGLAASALAWAAFGTIVAVAVLWGRRRTATPPRAPRPGA